MLLRQIPYFLVAMIAIFAMITPSKAAVEIGHAAPEIEATDINGDAFKLSDHRGKIVVLEWTNKGCPFVHKHYDSGNMQKLQKEALGEGVEWVSIISSAEGKQGYVTPEEAKAWLAEQHSEPTTQILDPSGTIGNAYGAKTTPHMFVIDAEGKIAYMGAIDSDSSPRPESIEGATNYVTAAIDALKAGAQPEITSTAPYGCSVKYDM